MRSDKRIKRLASGPALYAEYQDPFGGNATVQEATLGDQPIVWVGSGERIALSVDQAKEVRDALDAFASEHDK